MKNQRFIIIAISTILFAVSVAQLQAQKVDKILSKHYKAVGAEKLSQVKSVHSTGTMEISAMGQLMEMDFTTQQARPMKMRVDVSLQGMSFSQVYNDGTGWMINPMSGQVENMPDEQASQMERQADIDGFLYNYKDKGYQIAFEGKDELDGTKVFKLKVTPETGEPFFAYLDKKSKYLIKVTGQTNMQGQMLDSETHFKNFKTIDGIVFPYDTEVVVNGEPMMTMMLSEVALNKEVAEDAFDKP